MTTARTRTAVALVLLALVASLPASAHTTDWFTCLNPSPQTSGQPSDSDCTAHLDWMDKADWLSISFPAGSVFNHDENSAYPDGVDDPDDEQQIGEVSWQTNFSWDLDCSTGDDLQDGGTYSVTWEDTWSSFTPPSGWAKVAEYSMIALFVNVPMHLIYNPTTGDYRLEIDLPTTLTCNGTPQNFRLRLWSHEGNNGAFEWVVKNPSTAGSHSVTAAVTLPSGATHTDSATITTT